MVRNVLVVDTINDVRTTNVQWVVKTKTKIIILTLLTTGGFQNSKNRVKRKNNKLHISQITTSALP